MNSMVKLMCLCLVVAFPARRTAGIDHSPFGLHGEGGERNGQSMRIRPGGSVHELDAFVCVDGLDLNGSEFGTSARLSRDALPAELGFAFTNRLSDDLTDLILTYTLRNDGSVDLDGVRFFGLLDAEIDEEVNTFFNEYGESAGTAGTGSGDPLPDFWQIDEPGFAGGTLMQGLLQGALNQVNAVPEGQPDDVALGLGFDLGRIRPSEVIEVSLVISEDGQTLGDLSLVHRDEEPGSTTVITYSGLADRALRELTNVIVTGATVIQALASQTNVCRAYFSDASVEDVSVLAAWGLAQPEPAGTVVSGAVLRAGGVTNDTPVTVQAAYTYRAVTMTGTLDVLIVTSPAVYVDVTGQVELEYAWALDQHTGALVGTLRVTNANTGRSLGGRFHLAMHPSADFFYPQPDGTMQDGDRFVDLTAAIEAALRRAGGDARLDPGESVEVSGFRVYSRARRPPPAGLFELWTDTLVGQDETE